jgi:hypothetical protein
MISKPEKNSHGKKMEIYKYEICGNILLMLHAKTSKLKGVRK